MNSKELLEQADQRVKNINRIKVQLENSEAILSVIDTSEVALYGIGGTTCINSVLSEKDMLELNTIVANRIAFERNNKSAEMEKLLGIAKVGEVTVDTVNDKVLQVGDATPSPDPVADKLTEILQQEADRIEKPAEKFEVKSITAVEPEGKSMDKYPAKKDPRKKLPENMTEEAVYQMLIIEKKKPKEIAAHYGLTSTQVSQFIYQHDIRHKAKKAPKPDKQPEETERP